MELKIVKEFRSRSRVRSTDNTFSKLECRRVVVPVEDVDSPPVRQSLRLVGVLCESVEAGGEHEDVDQCQASQEAGHVQADEEADAPRSYELVRVDCM